MRVVVGGVCAALVATAVVWGWQVAGSPERDLALVQLSRANPPEIRAPVAAALAAPEPPAPAVPESSNPFARDRTARPIFHQAAGLPPGPSTVATALGRTVGVYLGPDGGASPAIQLRNPLPLGGPLLFLVLSRQGDWLEVLLPVRPNGSAGWIHAGDVSLDRHDFRITVELESHRLTVFHSDVPVLQTAVGLGRGATPTPGGIFYTKELIEPIDGRGRYNPAGPYGPYAYSLSGFSNVLFNFGGGPGTIGIHGTNESAGLGRDVSHGCIRVSNDAITFMARTLPLGVPVEVVA